MADSEVERHADSHPGERLSDRTFLDRLQIHARENWYRDLWLAVITTALVIFGLVISDVSHSAKQAAEQARLAADQAKSTAAQASDLARDVKRQADQVQTSRVAAIQSICMSTWRSNNGIHQFILGPPLPGRPRAAGPNTVLGRALRKRLDDSFPLIAHNEKSAEKACLAYARQISSIKVP